MDIKKIDAGNIEEYTDIIAPDIAENMVRMYYRGLACHDPGDVSLKSALIWELQAVEEDADTESRIDCIYARAPEDLNELLSAYHNEAVDEEVKRSFFELPSLEKGIQGELKDRDFDIDAVEGMDVHITIDELSALPLAKKKAPDFVHSLADLDTTAYHQGIMRLLLQSDACPMEDMCYIPKSWFEQDISCYVITDGKVNGFLLIHEFPSGILMPVFFRATGADASRHIAYMMIYSINQAAKKYSGDRTVLIRRRAPYIEALVEKFFPGRKGEPAVAGERKE